MCGAGLLMRVVLGPSSFHTGSTGSEAQAPEGGGAGTVGGAGGDGAGVGVGGGGLGLPTGAIRTLTGNRGGC
jgi:hypothetical protein